MPQRVYTPEWRNANSTTTYPFAAAATLTARDGAVIPEGIFLDAALFPVGGAAGLFLSSIAVDSATIVIAIGNEGREALCTGQFAMSAVPDRLTLRDAQGRDAGALVAAAGQLAVLQGLGRGTHSFDPAAAPFCASTVFPTPELGVRGIQLEDGTLLAGDVWLLGDDGVVLGVTEEVLPAQAGTPPRTVQVIRVDVVGDPLYRRRLCGGSLFTPPAFVRALRLTGPGGQAIMVVPDSAGQITVTATSVDAADTVLRLTPTEEGVEIAAVGATAGG